MKKVIFTAIILLVWASVAMGHPRVEIYRYPSSILPPPPPPHRIYYVPSPPIYVPVPLPHVGQGVIIDRGHRDHGGHGHVGNWIFRW